MSSGPWGLPLGRDLYCAPHGSPHFLNRDPFIFCQEEKRQSPPSSRPSHTWALLPLTVAPTAKAFLSQRLDPPPPCLRSPKAGPPRVFPPASDRMSWEGRKSSACVASFQLCRHAPTLQPRPGPAARSPPRAQGADTRTQLLLSACAGPREAQSGAERAVPSRGCSRAPATSGFTCPSRPNPLPLFCVLLWDVLFSE